MNRQRYQDTSEYIRRILLDPTPYRRVTVGNITCVLVAGVRYVLHWRSPLDSDHPDLSGQWVPVCSLRPDKADPDVTIVTYAMRTPFAGLFEQRARDGDKRYRFRPSRFMAARPQPDLERAADHTRHRSRSWSSQQVARIVDVPFVDLRDMYDRTSGRTRRRMARFRRQQHVAGQTPSQQVDLAASNWNYVSNHNYH